MYLNMSGLFFPTCNLLGGCAPPSFCLVSITLIKYVILTRQKQGGFVAAPSNKLQEGKN